MPDKIIVPMTVLAHRLKSSINVPQLNPDYKNALVSYLGKDSTPTAFNENIVLKKGVHLHFVLPSSMKKGKEVVNKDGIRTFEYPLVPDRYIVTRMYFQNGKIQTDCNIIESNFCSCESDYKDSVTIPKFNDTDERHRYRYIGRTYSTLNLVPEPSGNYEYLSNLTAVGAGDPMFNAYYPNCKSVFGFYDDLKDVPEDAVLSYFVLGYYSDNGNDPFNNVSDIDDMKKVLSDYNLKAENDDVCNSCMLFGEVCGINLLEDTSPPLGEINVGIGKTSAEALSAIISEKYYPQKDIERFITSLQYDIADEVSQIDGNFKIDDTIHLQGFSSIDSIENNYTVIFTKDKESDDIKGYFDEYSELCNEQRDLGKLRRLLEYKKNSLYYLWEIYVHSSSSKKEMLKEKINLLIDDISKCREKISSSKENVQNKFSALEGALKNNDIKIEKVSTQPFYYPKDPALMLFGSGMNRTYAFGEDGRFESDNTLYCLTSPLTSDLPESSILSLFCDTTFFNILEDFQEYIIMAVLLDNTNLLPMINLQPQIERKYSPAIINNNPFEDVTLFMQWETSFSSDYCDSNPALSSLEYENTDYIYKGQLTENKRYCNGVSVLTPHGVYNLQNKLKKYIENHSDTSTEAEITDEISDIAAISQNLGGFNINLAALNYAFQFPLDLDTSDTFSKKVSDCLFPQKNLFYEPTSERLAVLDNTSVFPLREGFLDLSKLAIVSSFGEQRKILDDELTFKGKRYFSENLEPIVDNCCFLPLNLTTPARLSTSFVSAINKEILSCSLPEGNPIIGIFLPDMLNRNLNVYDNSGVLIGILKTAYRYINGKKTAVGRFVKSPDVPTEVDVRITSLIMELTKDNSYFSELMNVIDEKLNKIIPMYQNDFIFGRALVMAEIAVELEYYGGTEWSKLDNDIGTFNDVGLSNQRFPVMFGDVERVTDGVCCGFYDGFEKGFTAFGYDNNPNNFLNAPPFTISACDKVKNVTLLFDPLLKVTVTTGFLPVQQLQINASHSDFSKMNLLSAELNTLISENNQIQLPDLSKGEKFVREYPVIIDDKTKYKSLNVVNSLPVIGAIENTIITDGIILKNTNV